METLFNADFWLSHLKVMPLGNKMLQIKILSKYNYYSVTMHTVLDMIFKSTLISRNLNKYLSYFSEFVYFDDETKVVDQT